MTSVMGRYLIMGGEEFVKHARGVGHTVIVCDGLGVVGRRGFGGTSALWQRDALVLVPSFQYRIPVLDTVFAATLEMIPLDVLPMAAQSLDGFDENFVLLASGQLLAAARRSIAWIDRNLTSLSRHSLRSRSGSRDCCHLFAHSAVGQYSAPGARGGEGAHGVGFSSQRGPPPESIYAASKSIISNASAVMIAYLCPNCCTPCASRRSSLLDHCPFFNPPATELNHLLRQSLFVRPGSLFATLHQSLTSPSLTTQLSQRPVRLACWQLGTVMRADTVPATTRGLRNGLVA